MEANVRHIVYGIAGLFLGVLQSCSLLEPDAEKPVKIYRSTLVGKVVNKGNDGMSGVSITSKPGGHTTVSLTDGYFSLPDIEAGTYTFHFHQIDFLDTSTSEMEIGLRDTQELREDMVLTFRFGVVKGTVFFPVDTPLAMAGVAVEQQNVSASTYSRGTFLLNRVEPGTVNLFASYPGLGYGTATAVSVHPDDTTEDVVILLDRKGGTVRGRVVDEKEKPVAKAVVTAVGGVLSDTTDTAGSFSISEIPSRSSVVLNIRTAEDTVLVSGIEVTEGGATAIEPVTVRPAEARNNMKLWPAQVSATADQDSVVLLVNSSTSSNVRIDHYVWDLDGDSDFETRTDIPRLVIPTPSIGTTLMAVKGISADSLASPAATITLTVAGSAPPDSTIAVSPPQRPM